MLVVIVKDDPKVDEKEEETKVDQKIAEQTQVDETTKRQIPQKRMPNEKTLYMIDFFFEHLKFTSDELLVINETDAVSIDNFMN